MTTEAKPLPYANKGNLVEGPVRKHLIRLAAPMTWGIMMMISFQLVNVFFISLLGDTKILAAISFTFPVTYLLFSFLMGFSIAMASVVSRLIGQGGQEIVQRVTSHGLLFGFLISLLITAVGIWGHDALFRMMGANEEMLPLIKQYMHIWFAGLIFVSVPLIGNAAIRANGDSATPAMIMTGAALLNVVLDAVLIFGLLGFPRLELQGAAIGSVIANGFAFVACFYVLVFKQRLFSFRVAFAQIKMFGDSVKRLMFIALPAGITNSIQPMVNAIILSLLAKHNVEAVAAFGVVTRIEAFAFVILMGLAVGMAPIIGQNWGAKRYDRVNETLHLAMQFNILWSLAIALVLGVFAKPIAGIFSDDPQVIFYASHFFWMVPFSYALGNLVNGWASAFNAMGMPQRAFVMIIVRMVLLMIPAVYIGNHFGGVIGIFIAIAAVNVVTGLFFHLTSWQFCKQRAAEAVSV